MGPSRYGAAVTGSKAKIESMFAPTAPPQHCYWFACIGLVLSALGGCASAPSTASRAPTTPQAQASQSLVPQAAGISTGRAPPTQAGNDAIGPQQDFARWVTGFVATARAAGISEAALHSAFDEVHYIPRVVELDRAQPEFTRTVWDYLDSAVSPQRIALGKDKLLQVRLEADAAAARYGVPSSILAAIWGMESNYGADYGNIPTIDALATLGFEGRRDIWGSMADVMASTANFLARSGWQAGQPWGAEVQLPPGFDYGRADAALRQSSAQWAAEGVRSMEGTPLPEFVDGAILLPVCLANASAMSSTSGGTAIPSRLLIFGKQYRPRPSLSTIPAFAKRDNP